ncbi:MAG TPA: hypothetical protein PLK76_03260 [bacterium]|nr:hypothetical protein [bacterium]
MYAPEIKKRESKDPNEKLIFFKIEEYVKTCFDYIKEAQVSEQIKETIVQVLTRFVNGGFINSNQFGLNVRDTIDTILTITQKDTNPESESKKLYENLKEVLWLLFDEIKGLTN